jgi:SAM-dependent methyltransferase
MLRFIDKAETWTAMDKGLHSELGWLNNQIHLKTWQDVAVYLHVKDMKDRRIAEIGGGNSRILRKIAPHNSCVNVDKLEGQHGGPSGDQGIPGVETVRSFLGEYSPDLPDASFDAVISVSVVEHVPNPTAGAFFDDMLRIMKPGALSLHAIDLYVGDEEIANSAKRLEIYTEWLNRPEVEPLQPIEARRAVFSTTMATNPDLTMWHWNRAAPALKETRETAQSVSLLCGFKKREI